MDHASSIPIPQDLEPDQEVMLKNLQGGELGLGTSISHFPSQIDRLKRYRVPNDVFKVVLAVVPAIKRRLANPNACPFDWAHWWDFHPPAPSWSAVRLAGFRLPLLCNHPESRVPGVAAAST